MNEELDNQQITQENKVFGINEQLVLDADSILNQGLTPDNFAQISQSTPLYDVVNTKGNILSDKQWFDEYIKQLAAISSPEIWEHHKSEIENVSKTIDGLLFLIRWISFLTIAMVMLCIIFDRNQGAIISGTVGGVVDVILGYLMHAFNTTLKSKKSYFDSANELAKIDRMLFIVQTISNQNEKDSVISDIVRKYFDIERK